MLDVQETNLEKSKISNFTVLLRALVETIPGRIHERTEMKKEMEKSEISNFTLETQTKNGLEKGGQVLSTKFGTNWLDGGMSWYHCE